MERKPAIRDTRENLGGGICKDVFCDQPCTIIGVDRSTPAEMHVMGPDRFIISHRSIYGDFCYLHNKIDKGLIQGVIHKKK